MVLADKVYLPETQWAANKRPSTKESLEEDKTIATAKKIASVTLEDKEYLFGYDKFLFEDLWAKKRPLTGTDATYFVQLCDKIPAQKNTGVKPTCSCNLYYFTAGGAWAAAGVVVLTAALILGWGLEAILGGALLITIALGLSLYAALKNLSPPLLGHKMGVDIIAFAGKGTFKLRDRLGILCFGV